MGDPCVTVLSFSHLSRVPTELSHSTGGEWGGEWILWCIGAGRLIFLEQPTASSTSRCHLLATNRQQIRKKNKLALRSAPKDASLRGKATLAAERRRSVGCEGSMRCSLNLFWWETHCAGGDRPTNPDTNARGTIAAPNPDMGARGACVPETFVGGEIHVPWRETHCACQQHGHDTFSHGSKHFFALTGKNSKKKVQ